MRWASHKLGDRRTVEKFAWLPTRLNDGNTVWLENYLVEQQFLDASRFGYGPSWYFQKSYAKPPIYDPLS